MEFITAEDKERLEKQLAELKKRRPVISRRIAEARELGDLSENAEYHAAREDQGMDEAKIRQIEERLAKARVATDDQEIPQDMVFVGATVRLRNVDSGAEDVYRIVGDASAHLDGDDDIIEVTSNSPIGRALDRARIGETIRADLPRGTKRFEVVSIE